MDSASSIDLLTSSSFLINSFLSPRPSLTLSDSLLFGDGGGDVGDDGDIEVGDEGDDGDDGDDGAGDDGAGDGGDDGDDGDEQA